MKRMMMALASATWLAAPLLASGCDIRRVEEAEPLAGGNITRVAMGYSLTSAFIIGTDGGLALVDTGEGGEDDPLLERIAARGHTPEDVHDVFFTHGHQDHVGGASSFPNAVFHALAAEVPIVEGREAPMRPLPSGGPELTGITVGDVLEDESVTTVGGIDVEVFALPGHTVGSAAYLIQGVLLLAGFGKTHESEV